MFIYFEMYKNIYGYMYFYTFFNNNTMHLIVLLLKTSVPVPSKMMAPKKKHLIFYCHFIYFTFNLFPEKKILKIKLFLAIRKLDTGLSIINRR